MAASIQSRPARVVVVAFGPSDTTSAAHARARRLVGDDGDAVVVAAHRGVAPDRAVPVGADALRAALPDTDAPVLVLHDDVHIGREGVAALLRAWRATGEVVVPWMDAPHTDQHVPTEVPGDDDARARLARRLPLRGGRAELVRPACLVASGRRLRLLTDRFVTVADAVWSDPSVVTHVAAGALAHHTGRCVAAAPPESDRPLLVAAMIVRDEADTLPDCLASLDGVVDRIEICDTGSIDDTVTIARDAGAGVIERPWRNDFGWARNQVLERCRDAEWILQIDADERVRCEDPAALRARLARLVGSARVCAVAIDNLDDHDRIGSTHHGARVVRTEGTRYEGALHERVRFDDTVAGAGEPVTFSLGELRLEHLGYRRGIVAGRGKAERNQAISEQAYRDDPGWETAFNLARSLGMTGDADAGRITALLHETLRGGDAVPLTWRAWALARLGSDELAAGDPQAALTHAREALALVPADPVAGAVLAEAAERLDRPDVVVEQRSTRRTTRSARPFSDLGAAAARLTDVEIASLLAFGETDEAYAEAADALRRHPDSFTAWPALVRSVAGADDTATVDDLLVAAALRDGSGGCLSALAKALPPARAARLCVRYVDEGGDDVRAIRDGLAAAIVCADAGLVAALLPDASRLEPAVLQKLADAAGRRGMHTQREALARLSDRTSRNFVVCGAAHSGVAHTSVAFTALGHPCGHELLFDPYHHQPSFGALQGDASWFALPHLDLLPDDAVIFHQVRDPLVVIDELMRHEMLGRPSPLRDFVAEHAPHVLEHDDLVSRCADYWITWNIRLSGHADARRPYVRFRVEDLGVDALAQLTGLLGSHQSPDAVSKLLDRTPADAATRTAATTTLPDGALTDRLLETAAELGYQLTGAA